MSALTAALSVLARSTLRALLGVAVAVAGLFGLAGAAATFLGFVSVSLFGPSVLHTAVAFLVVGSAAAGTALLFIAVSLRLASPLLARLV